MIANNSELRKDYLTGLSYTNMLQGKTIQATVAKEKDGAEEAEYDWDTTDGGEAEEKMTRHDCGGIV